MKNFALAKFVSALLSQHVLPSRPDAKGLRILEIGAGYGGMAEALIRLMAVQSYTVVDLPEILPLSRYYLTQTHPDTSLAFIEADQIDQLNSERYDVVINTMSFGEMPKETAQAYVLWAMEHSDFLISHNSVKRTPSGVKKHSEYGFQNYRVEQIIAQPDVSGAFNAQHLVLVVKNGAPNMTADQLDELQTFVSLGLHEDLNDGNRPAMEAMRSAASAWFFRKSHLLNYLATGRSMLARAYAERLLGLPLEAPDYIKRALQEQGRLALIRLFKKAL